jgi:hypothetical protein
MELEEAKELLKLHTLPGDEFLGSLRPYQGLIDKNFHEVMQAIIAVAPHLQQDKKVIKKY